jgi:hypothetical protein
MDDIHPNHHRPSSLYDVVSGLREEISMREPDIVGTCVQCNCYLYEDSEFNLANSSRRITPWGVVYEDEYVCLDCEQENLLGGPYG